MDSMRLFKTTDSIREHLHFQRLNEKSIALVPTMGALHFGHVKLVRQALELADHVVVSIFVNPRQFNNQDDLLNYPRTLDDDIELLSDYEEVSIFAPTEIEIYPQNFREINIPLGILDEVMEAKFRPGHFKGVVNVVHQLFNIIEPDYALFGKKDLQQLAVIRKLTGSLHSKIKIIPCETIREDNGLASSSRNLRLTESEFEEAAIIHQALSQLKRKAYTEDLANSSRTAIEQINSKSLRVEYLEIVDGESFEPLEDWLPGACACVAVLCGKVRLIDNLELIPKAVYC